MIDPTDARRIVREVARAAGVDPDAVLGRDRTVASVRRAAMLELRRRGCSHRAIARTFGRTPGTIGEVLRPWRIGSSGRRRTRRRAVWRPDRARKNARAVKDFVEEWAAQLERSGSLGELVQVPIDAASASSTVELVAAVSGRRIVLVSLDVTSDADVTLELRSGATVIGGAFAAARSQYHFFDKITATDNAALNLARSANAALKGTLVYRLL